MGKIGKGCPACGMFIQKNEGCEWVRGILLLLLLLLVSLGPPCRANPHPHLTPYLTSNR